MDAARHAWEMMVRDADPMPGWAALDYVNEHTEDRGAAVRLLHGAAAGWLRGRDPWRARHGIFHHIEMGDLDGAEKWLEGFGPARKWRGRGPDFEGVALWCDDAARCVALLRELSAVPGGAP